MTQVEGFLTPTVAGDTEPSKARNMLQALLDEAWNQGMRPIGYKEIKNDLEAVKYHLEDMRTLVFKK